MARKAKSELERDFESIQGSEGQLKENVEKINKARDELINNTAKKVITETYLNSQYGSAYTDFINSGGTKDEFIEQKMSLDTKIEVIAKYTNNDRIFGGENGFEAKLRDTQIIKKQRKQRYAQRGREILREYKEALDRNQARINKLEQEINEIKDNIKSAREKIRDIAATQDEQINRQNQKAVFDKQGSKQIIEEQIAELQAELATKQTELKEYKELQAKFRAEFVKRKDELTAFLEEEKIFIAEETGQTQTGTAQEENEKQNNEGIGIGGGSEKPMSTHAVAVSMLEDFIDRSPEEQRLLLEQCGSKDLLNMARKLDPINRVKFNSAIKRRLEELPEDSVEFGGRTIEKRHLLDGILEKEQIDAIRKELDEFNANIAKKTPEQIQAFEEKLKYIRAVCLLNETGAIKRFVNMIRGNNRNYIHDLSSSIAHYGDIKDKLVTNQENWIDTIRVTIGRTPKNPINKSTTKKLDRTKTDPLMR